MRLRNRADRTTVRRREKPRRGRPSLEIFEPRQLLTTNVGFVQGFVLDSSNNPVSGATVELLTTSNALAAPPTTTNSSGYYAFNNVAPSTYYVTESAAGYTTSVAGSDIQTTINPASPINGNTEIQVTVVDPTTQDLGIQWISGYSVDTVDEVLNPSPYNQAGAPFNENGTLEGQLQLQFLSPPGSQNLGNVQEFISLCSDLLNGVYQFSPFTVQPSLTPNTTTLPTDPSTASGYLENLGEIGYLYNTFGTTLQSGQTSAALQLALWALEYNQMPASGPMTLANPDFPMQVNMPATDPIVMTGNMFLSEAYTAVTSGNSQDAYFLNLNTSAEQAADATVGQGVLCTDLLNFTDTRSTTSQGSPAITTSQTPAIAYVGESISDTATVTGLVSPSSSDTVTFKLYNNSSASGTPLFTSSPVTVSISGSTATATSPGYTATVTGTDYWVASYSGDTNNAMVTSGTASEPVTIDQITTSQTPAQATVGSSIADTATVTGASPTGTVTFRLYNNPTGTGTPLYTSPAVTLVNGVATSPGYTATVTGTDYWVASYSGDTNNAMVTSGTASEPVTIDQITTSQTPAQATVGSSIADTATVTGASPTGTVTFRLYNNPTGTGTPLYTSPAVTLVNGVATSPGYTATATGTDYWVASYSGDTNNAMVTSGTASEPVTIDQITTSQTPAQATVGSSIADTATVTGASPTGTVTFRLYNNPTGTGTPLYTSPAVTLVNGVATSPGYTATATGTDYWVASYSGDTNNAMVTSGTASEPVTIDQITTSQTPAQATVGSSIADTATVTGASPTGTVTFRLYNNPTGTGTPLYTSPAVTLVNGVATSPGYTATVTGTDYWVASYSGDTNNAMVTSGTASEPVTIDQITTSQTPAQATVGSSIADTATVTGASPTGTVTFRLYNNPTGTGTPLYTSPAVTLVNGVATSPGYTATATGTDYWVASYSGDTNNAMVTSGTASEPVTIDQITTSQQPASASVDSSIADKATVTGASPTGTVTFTLYNNPNGTGTPLYTSPAVTLSGGMATSPGYIATATGTDYWVATYNGDRNNSPVTSPATAEPVTITPTTPSITTTPGGPVMMGGITISGTKFLDVTGNGFSSDDTPQSGVTINLYSGSTLVASTKTANDGTYSFPGLAPGSYYVQESVPAGNIQTGGGPNGTAGNTYYTVTASAGHSYSGYNFDDFLVPTCQPTSISYKVTTPSGYSQTFSQLDGNTAPGDTVTVNFTVPAGMSDTLTLVSYYAPSSSFSDSNAYEQLIYQQATKTFAPGTYSGTNSLTVKIPNTDYQIDFVCGQAISQLEPNQNNGVYGPDSAEITYHAEDRFIDSDSGGSTPGTMNTASPTVPNPTTTTAATSSLTDSATLTGGNNPTGTITFYLFAPGVTPNASDSNNVYSDAVTVNGNSTYTTSIGNHPGGYVPTTTGTYEWVAVYSGDSNNAMATSSFGSEPWIVKATPSITTTPGGPVMMGGITISGTKFLDVTGNGFSSDDTPQSGVTINLYSGSTLVASTKTANDGTYSFPGLAPGSYYVQESVPAGNIQTGGGPNGTAGNTYYTVTASAGHSYSGYNFDDFLVPTCQPTSISYKVTTPSGYSQTFSQLDGNTAPGDTVTVNFTVPAGMSDTLTLVSYYAPSSSFSDSNAYEQLIYQQATKTFAPGTYSGTNSLTVKIPNTDYQIDFVCGQAISQLEPNQNNGVYGPDSAEITYHAEDRFIDSDSGGSTPGTMNTASPTVPNPTTTTAATSSLTDSATLTGGNNPTGTITFYLFAPGVTPNASDSNNVYSDAVTVNGNSTYTTGTGIQTGSAVPTQAGTYQWVAVYNGDSNNNGATSPFGSEPWTVVQPMGSPSISTTPNTSNTYCSSTLVLKDTATISGGNNPTGTITFTLYLGSTKVDTETVTVNGDGSYTTPGYKLPTTGTVSGTYQWNATYSGDSNDNPASDINDPSEQVVVGNASPSISTSPNTTTGYCSSSTLLKDTAMLSGGDYPTGTITFTLYSPTGKLLDTETVTVNGNGTYSTPKGYTLSSSSATGTYQWDATYSGDSDNDPDSDNNDKSEQVVVSKSGGYHNATLGDPSLAYTPAQIRAAYGISGLSQDGTGQTIAIVDAYDDPGIFASLDTFDAQFGLTDSGPSLYDQYGAASSFLTVLNQNGQTTNLPGTDPSGAGSDNWEVEEALDVEWVHAMAPGAQIILVEASSQSLSDLMTGVAAAASHPGVSVVSMSWGFPEGQDVFAADEARYDSVFNVPGVTFLASTGDYGTADPEYPAYSPNVVAVGGTSLNLNADNSYNGETGWGYYSNSAGVSIGSGGGLSMFETEPSYQQGVQSTGSRTTPDVSFDADPATGAWVVDSYNLDASNPFEVVGGTSLSAPAFAGLMALVNQGRVASGEATLNSSSPTEVQQALYSLPQSNYNSITSGNNGYAAETGYNLVTGLGTPVADLMVPNLVAYQGPGTSYAGPTVGRLQDATLTSVWTGGGGTANAVKAFDALTASSSGLGQGQAPGAAAASTSSISTPLSVTAAQGMVTAAGTTFGLQVQTGSLSQNGPVQAVGMGTNSSDSGDLATANSNTPAARLLAVPGLETLGTSGALQSQSRRVLLPAGAWAGSAASDNALFVAAASPSVAAPAFGGASVAVPQGFSTAPGSIRLALRPTVLPGLRNVANTAMTDALHGFTPGSSIAAPAFADVYTPTTAAPAVMPVAPLPWLLAPGMTPFSLDAVDAVLLQEGNDAEGGPDAADERAGSQETNATAVVMGVVALAWRVRSHLGRSGNDRDRRHGRPDPQSRRPGRGLDLDQTGDRK